ncbi:hypothetical protein QYF61_006702 [Mycteria americana]|uniref:Uncharacterized protein n=1 Tax=Mycteria americana TaxID=33587 RepID=A0AAN7P4G0_MYCAM|nr:hypothetical protein QYF61_006702 [Mycteria americana]
MLSYATAAAAFCREPASVSTRVPASCSPGMGGWVIKASNGRSVKAEVHLPFLDAFLGGLRIAVRRTRDNCPEQHTFLAAAVGTGHELSLGMMGFNQTDLSRKTDILRQEPYWEGQVMAAVVGTSASECYQIKQLTGWRLNHCPGQPVPMLDHPFSEVKFPNIQSNPPLAQLEAISSCPITCYLGEETDPHLATTSFQAKQPQFPQPLLIRLLLQTLHQLRCPSLDTLQPLNVSLVCMPIKGLGFVLGAYECICKAGFYHPNIFSVNSFQRKGAENRFSGGELSEEVYTCLPCREGCSYCTDDTPCYAQEDKYLRLAIISFQTLCMLLDFISMLVVYHFRKAKALTDYERILQNNFQPYGVRSSWLYTQLQNILYVELRNKSAQGWLKKTGKLQWNQAEYEPTVSSHHNPGKLYTGQHESIRASGLVLLETILFGSLLLYFPAIIELLLCSIPGPPVAWEALWCYLAPVLTGSANGTKTEQENKNELHLILDQHNTMKASSRMDCINRTPARRLRETPGMALDEASTPCPRSEIMQSQSLLYPVGTTQSVLHDRRGTATSCSRFLPDLPEGAVPHSWQARSCTESHSGQNATLDSALAGSDVRRAGSAPCPGEPQILRSFELIALSSHSVQSILLSGAQNWTQHSRSGLNNAEQRDRTTYLNLLNISTSTTLCADYVPHLSDMVDFGQQSASEHGDGYPGSRELLSAALAHSHLHREAGLKKHKRKAFLAGKRLGALLTSVEEEKEERTTAEFLFLLWGVYLCYAVRTVPSAFHEPRYMAVAVHNELIISAIFHTIRQVICRSILDVTERVEMPSEAEHLHYTQHVAGHVDQRRSNTFILASRLQSDWMLMLFFAHTHLTVTVTVGLLLIPKLSKFQGFEVLKILM